MGARLAPGARRPARPPGRADGAARAEPADVLRSRPRAARAMERSDVHASPDPHDERARVLSLVRRFGWNATSFQVLEPGLPLLLSRRRRVRGVRRYRPGVGRGGRAAGGRRALRGGDRGVRAGRARRAIGARVSSPPRIASRSRVPLRSLLVGEQPVWEPDALGRGARGAARACASSSGARAPRACAVRALDARAAAAPGAESRAAVARVRRALAGARELAPLGFLARVDPLALLPDRPLFVAERAGALVGILSVAPIHGREGWLLQNLLRAPDAPNGTAEVLFDQAMRAAAARGLTFVTLGLAPLAGRVAAPLRLARHAGRACSTSRGCARSRPSCSRRAGIGCTLSFPEETWAARAILDVLSAFAHGQSRALRARDACCAGRRCSSRCWRCCWCRGHVCSRRANGAAGSRIPRSSGAGWRSTSASPSRCSRCAGAGGRRWPACWSRAIAADAVGDRAGGDLVERATRDGRGRPRVAGGRDAGARRRRCWCCPRQFGGAVLDGQRPERLGDFTAGPRTIADLRCWRWSSGVLAAYVATGAARADRLLHQPVLLPALSHGAGLAGRPSRSASCGGAGAGRRRLIIGLMARYGSERIRGHGIPEAIEAILISGSRDRAEASRCSSRSRRRSRSARAARSAPKGRSS